MNNTLSLTDMLHAHGVTAQWTFTTYYRGVNQRSPRVFDTIDEALRAVVDKLHMHAIDHEYPMVSLIMLRVGDQP